MMDPETKLRLLASADATLQGIFGVSNFRWFMYGQLPQGYIQRGVCARIKRVSTSSGYVQEGPLNLERVRFQFDVMSLDPSETFTATKAIADWMQTVDLMSGAQFTSPPTTPTQFPNYQLNQRSWIEAQPEGQVYVQMTDWLVFNNSNT